MSYLSRFRLRREYFDPKNAAHVASLKIFIKTGNWGEIQFFPEQPYENVPTTVLMKYAEHNLKVQSKDTVAKKLKPKAAKVLAVS